MYAFCFFFCNIQKMQNEFRIEDNPTNNNEVVKIQRYYSQQKNMIPQKEKIIIMNRKTDWLSELNYKCSNNRSKMILRKPDVISRVNG